MPKLRTESGTKKEAIRLLAIAEPDLTPRQISQKLNVCKWYVYKVLQQAPETEISPLARRLSRLEARVKTNEAIMLKILKAKGLKAEEFGL